MKEGEGKKDHVVIIDDDRSVGGFISHILTPDYSVTYFESAEEALESADMAVTDAIITDVNLPGINGIEFLKRVQSSGREVPVIVVTGYNDIDIAIAALKSGAFDFILKPFKADQIGLSVRKAIEGRRLVHENRKLLEELRHKNEVLEDLNMRIQSRNMEIENDLDIASNLQKCLFPVTFPRIDSFGFHLKFKPVEKVSGDFFDFILRERNNFSFIFADVSGHGVPAALYSAMMKTAINTVWKNMSEPSDFVREINDFIIGIQKEMSYNYATLFYGVFDIDREVLTYCNAGMPAPVLIRRDGEIICLEPNSPFVGLITGLNFISDTVDLKPGDRIVFYTDGAYECAGMNDSIMGQRIFIEKLGEYAHFPIEDIVESIYSDVVSFCAGGKSTDDITILGMKYR
jgi:serine phosphatase RsbU (regulator of sigma subunit)